MLLSCTGNFAKAATYGDEESGPYATISYNAWIPTYSSSISPYVPKVLNGLAATGGWRFGRYYAVESGYSYGVGSSPFVDVTVQSWSLDGLLLWPLHRTGKSALYADVGAAEMWTTVSSAYAFGWGDSIGARFGVGGLFQFTDQAAIRADVKYQFTGLSGARTVVIATAGLVWDP
jgi:hypothetical protein